MLVDLKWFSDLLGRNEVIASLIVLATIDVVSLKLKWIITVEPTAGHPHKNGRSKVRGKHQRSPAFVLSNMNGFVFARDIERGVSLPKNRVAQS